MRNSFFGFLFFGTLILLAGSCKKGELPAEYYYSRLELSLVPLPNTPKMDVYLDGKKLMVLDPSAPSNIVLPVQQGKLELFESGSPTALADTMIYLEANKKVSLRFAHSADFGLSGFVTGGAVSPDSFAVQFMNELSDFYKPYTSLNLEICRYDFNTGEYVPTGDVIEEFTSVKLSPKRIVLALRDEYQQDYFYYGRFKNNLTGEYIMQPSWGMEFFFMGGANGGTNNVFRLRDNAGDVEIAGIEF